MWGWTATALTTRRFKAMETAKFLLRPYRPEDCSALIRLFCESVHGAFPGLPSCREDYTSAELAAWAPILTGREAAERERAWAESLAAHYTIVAEQNGEPVGFGDLAAARGAYLDRLYVLPRCRGQGIASSLARSLEKEARSCGFSLMTVHTSRTARSFFERRGYRLLYPQTVVRKNRADGAPVLLENFAMEKTL